MLKFLVTNKKRVLFALLGCLYALLVLCGSKTWQWKLMEL